MPVTTLATVNQLAGRSPIQLGTVSEPCTVLFALTDIDKDKPWRSIKIVPNDDDLVVLKEFDDKNDDLQDIVKTHDDTEFITIKFHEKLTKAFNEDKTKADLASTVARDQRVKIVVRPYKWKMNDQKGVSLRGVLVVGVDDDVSIDDVL
jgi:hypothetical protein